MARRAEREIAKARKTRADSRIADKWAMQRMAVNLSEYETEIKLLKTMLKDCADALAEEVEGHYRETKDHPAMKRHYDLDMAPAVAAYKLLGIEKEPAVG